MGRLWIEMAPTRCAGSAPMATERPRTGNDMIPQNTMTFATSTAAIAAFLLVPTLVTAQSTRPHRASPLLVPPPITDWELPQIATKTPAGTWTPLADTAPEYLAFMLLLSNGNILAYSVGGLDCIDSLAGIYEGASLIYDVPADTWTAATCSIGNQDETK